MFGLCGRLVWVCIALSGPGHAEILRLVSLRHATSPSATAQTFKRHTQQNMASLPPLETSVEVQGAAVLVSCDVQGTRIIVVRGVD
jgi:hypothetical protein